MSGKWMKEFDAGSKAYYYYNVETYETTWDKPADYQDDVGADNLSVSEGLIMLKSVKRIQRGYRAKLARGAMRVKRAEKHMTENKMGNCKWVATFDPQSKASYYYHVETHETTWDPPAEWLKWDKKQHPEKYASKADKQSLDLSVKNGGSSGSSSLDAIGLTAGGNAQGLGGLNLDNSFHDPNSHAGRLGGRTGQSKDAGGGTGGGGGLGLGVGSAYAVAGDGDGEENEESGETDALMGVGKDRKQYDNVSSARLKAIYGRSIVVDKCMDKCLEKCVAKCPKQCCCTMKWLWKYEGQPLKLPNPGADHMRGTGSLVIGNCFEPDLQCCAVVCPCMMYGCNERHIDERNDCGALCVPACLV